MIAAHVWSGSASLRPTARGQGSVTSASRLRGRGKTADEAQGEDVMYNARNKCQKKETCRAHCWKSSPGVCERSFRIQGTIIGSRSFCIQMFCGLRDIPTFTSLRAYGAFGLAFAAYHRSVHFSLCSANWRWKNRLFPPSVNAKTPVQEIDNRPQKSGPSHNFRSTRE
jgi:hypothetical protein